MSLKDHFSSFRELILLLSRHRQLTWELTRREISERYAGQVLGAFWAIGHPIIQMGIFVFVFSFIFRANVDRLDYVTYLLSGLIPWITFQLVMTTASTAIVANASLVKQVIFPLEVLPVKGVIASLFTQGISYLFLILYVLIRHQTLPWTYALLPLLFLIQLIAMIGLSFLLSAVGVYFKDLKDIVIVFCTMGLYLIPVIYLPSMVPALFRPLLYVNPFSYMVWCFQDLCFFGSFEHPWAWVVFPVLSLALFYGGYATFKRLKPLFGNVL